MSATTTPSSSYAFGDSTHEHPGPRIGDGSIQAMEKVSMPSRLPTSVIFRFHRPTLAFRSRIRQDCGDGHHVVSLRSVPSQRASLQHVDIPFAFVPVFSAFDSSTSSTHLDVDRSGVRHAKSARNAREWELHSCAVETFSKRITWDTG